MQLSRIDRITRTFDAASLLTELDPASLTGVSVALLPPRTSPTAATVWTSVTFANPTATVLFAGSDADSTGAVVVTGAADLWIKAAAGVEIETVRVERITLEGAGQLAGQVIASGQALIGLDTDGAPFYDPGGIGIPATIAVDTDSVLYYVAP